MAPDAASIKAGAKLATAGKWSEIGAHDRMVWGRCAGSGKTPYDVKFDRRQNGYHCTCPSRKFPCKHVLALLMLRADSPAAVPDCDQPPSWADDWLTAREEKQAKKAAASSKPKTDKPVNAKAQAKRAAARESKVADGLQRLELWMRDIVRRGIASLQSESDEFWTDAARRLNDAQCPTLATRVGALAAIPFSGEGWPQRMLAELGQITLLIDAYNNPDLPDPLRQEVRQLIGFPVSAADLAERGTTIPDRWALVAQTTETVENMQVERTWLVGRQTGRRGLMLQFAVGNRSFGKIVVPGIEAEGEVTAYPGVTGQRVAIGDLSDAAAITRRLPGDATIGELLSHHTSTLAANPWHRRSLAVLHDVRLLPPGVFRAGWWAVDSTGQALPLAKGDHWAMLATIGDAAVDLFAEWEGGRLQPLSCWSAAQGWRSFP